MLEKEEINKKKTCGCEGWAGVGHGLVEQEGRMMWMGGRSVGAEAGRAQQSCP